MLFERLQKAGIYPTGGADLGDLQHAILFHRPGDTDQAITVEVADRGPGLPAGEEEKVFEKFYQGDAAGGRGAGLGLAICRGVVKAHGGRIWAQNLPEGGVAFLFTLPLSGTPPASVPLNA